MFHTPFLFILLIILHLLRFNLILCLMRFIFLLDMPYKVYSKISVSLRKVGKVAVCCFGFVSFPETASNGQGTTTCPLETNNHDSREGGVILANS